jgi:tetratricopeptide (TPR) repeat protein
VRGELNVASARFGEALELDPTLLEARNDLAGILYDQGRYGRALREYQRVLALSPTEPHALMGSALSQVGLKDFSKASVVLEQMLLTEPENGETWLNLGDVASMMGRHTRARMCWQKAAEYSPAGSETLLHARRRLEAYPARR